MATKLCDSCFWKYLLEIINILCNSSQIAKIWDNMYLIRN